MSKPSFIYRSPLIYKAVIRLLYGRGYSHRYQAVAGEIGAEGSVLDVCCGDCTLARYVLPETRYVGVDVNKRFVEAARGKGIQCLLRDVGCDPLPASDVVVMMASLYQFVPGMKSILDKMLHAARRRVIITEPVRNLASSRVRFIRWLAARAADPGTGKKAFRFDAESFRRFLRSSYGSRVERIYACTANDREILAVLRP